MIFYVKLENHFLNYKTNKISNYIIIVTIIFFFTLFSPLFSKLVISSLLFSNIRIENIFFIKYINYNTILLLLLLAVIVLFFIMFILLKYTSLLLHFLFRFGDEGSKKPKITKKVIEPFNSKINVFWYKYSGLKFYFSITVLVYALEFNGHIFSVFYHEYQSIIRPYNTCLKIKDIIYIHNLNPIHLSLIFLLLISNFVLLALVKKLVGYLVNKYHSKILNRCLFLKKRFYNTNLILFLNYIIVVYYRPMALYTIGFVFDKMLNKNFINNNFFKEIYKFHVFTNYIKKINALKVAKNKQQFHILIFIQEFMKLFVRIIILFFFIVFFSIKIGILSVFCYYRWALIFNQLDIYTRGTFQGYVNEPDYYLRVLVLQLLIGLFILFSIFINRGEYYETTKFYKDYDILFNGNSSCLNNYTINNNPYEVINITSFLENKVVCCKNKDGKMSKFLLKLLLFIKNKPNKKLTPFKYLYWLFIKTLTQYVSIFSTLFYKVFLIQWRFVTKPIIQIHFFIYFIVLFLTIVTSIYNLKYTVTTLFFPGSHLVIPITAVMNDIVRAIKSILVSNRFHSIIYPCLLPMFLILVNNIKNTGRVVLNCIQLIWNNLHLIKFIKIKLFYILWLLLIKLCLFERKLINYNINEDELKKRLLANKKIIIIDYGVTHVKNTGLFNKIIIYIFKSVFWYFTITCLEVMFFASICIEIYIFYHTLIIIESFFLLLIIIL